MTQVPVLGMVDELARHQARVAGPHLRLALGAREAQALQERSVLDDLWAVVDGIELDLGLI